MSSKADGRSRDDLVEALAFADVLGTFRALPEASRRDFEAWVEKARDEPSRWRRIEALAMAMRAAPRLQRAEPIQISKEGAG